MRLKAIAEASIVGVGGLSVLKTARVEERSMFYQCWCKRLIACASLVVYLLANTHVNLAIGSHVEPARESTSAPTPAQQNGGENPLPPEDLVSECPHCAKRLKEAAEQRKAKTDKKCSASERENSDPSLPDDCPCCPKTPGAPSCPCPGGCALCSVAKVPCLVPDAPVPLSFFCLGDCLVEETFYYLPPFSGGLIRPPRA
jgi:hypothetical protein